jgi:hypothetical protein
MPGLHCTYCLPTGAAAHQQTSPQLCSQLAAQHHFTLFALSITLSLLLLAHNASCCLPIYRSFYPHHTLLAVLIWAPAPEAQAEPPSSPSDARPSMICRTMQRHRSCAAPATVVAAARPAAAGAAAVTSMQLPILLILC